MSADGFSQARLGRLSSALRAHVERDQVAGLVAVVARGDAVHVEMAGVQDLATGVPMRRDTLFRIASMTKPVTAVAAMMLVEEARLRLQEPVDRWLPELADRRVLRRIDGPLDDTVPAARPITLLHLLTMRMGLGMLMTGDRRHPIQKALAAAGLEAGPIPPDLPPDLLMARYGGLPLMAQPGERWLYHQSYDVLAVLIERAAGVPFAAFLDERIFGPLGMKDTRFAVPSDGRARLAGAYDRDVGTGTLVPLDAPAAVTPGGSTGLVSTVDDYLAFGRMMVRFGRHGTARLLARPTVEVMTTDQITAEQKAVSPFSPGFWDRNGWGFGVGIVTRRDAIAAVPGRYGWVGGLGTSWTSDPRHDLVTVLMVQRLMDDEQATYINEDFVTLAYQAIDD